MYLTTTLLTFAFAATGLAAPANSIQARDAATVMKALNMVTTSVKGLDKAVTSLNSSTDAIALGNIATMSQKLGDTVKAAQTMVEGTGPVSLLSAIQVMQSANGLTDSLMTTTTDLVTKKPIVDQAGLSPVVAQMLVMQKSASAGFSGAVTDKVPALAKSVAMGSAKKVNDALDGAIKAYMAGAAANGTANAAPAPAPAAGNSTSKAVLMARLVRV
jgi:Hydrophobic surface binding protein A